MRFQWVFALLFASLIARRAYAQRAEIRLDSSLRAPAFSAAIQRLDAQGRRAFADGVPIVVYLEFPSMRAQSALAESSDDSDALDAEPAAGESLEFELAVDHAGVARLVTDVAVLLRAQCPVVPSWAAIAQRASIARDVACRVIYGEPASTVAPRAAQLLASRGRAVSAADIERDLSVIPTQVRLSTAMIVPIAQWRGGEQFVPMQFVANVPVAPQRALHGAACRSFRRLFPISSSWRDMGVELVSQFPAWDSGAALSRCWGPRGEWALGVRDRSYLHRMTDEDWGEVEGYYHVRVLATLAHWDAQGRRRTLRIDRSVNEDFSMVGAFDLDGDGATEALVVHESMGAPRLEIYTARDGHIEPWNAGPPGVGWVADVDNDHVLDLIAPCPIRRGGELRQYGGESLQPDVGQVPLLELWQREASGGFSNRTPVSILFAAEQCPAIPRVMFSGPNPPLWQLIGNVRCARMRGLSAEETVFRLCSPEARVCETAIGRAAVQAAREDVPFLLQ